MKLVFFTLTLIVALSQSSFVYGGGNNTHELANTNEENTFQSTSLLLKRKRLEDKQETKHRPNKRGYQTRTSEKKLEKFEQNLENSAEISVEYMRNFAQNCINRENLETQDYATALGYLQILAKQGDPDDQYLLAGFYYYGWGLEKPDFEKAFHYFLESAKQGNKDAQYYLSRAYIMGQGTTTDVIEGLGWLVESHKQKNALATEVLNRVKEAHEKAKLPLMAKNTVIYMPPEQILPQETSSSTSLSFGFSQYCKEAKNKVLKLSLQRNFVPLLILPPSPHNKSTQ